MSNEESKQQEMMFKLQMFDQQMKQMQQQLEAVEQGIVEMTALDNGLSELVGKKGKEIYAPIGRGIFANATLISEELNVDVGGKNMVKKSIPDTKKIIADQLGKLDEVKKELERGMEKMGQEFTALIQEAQGAQGHVHDENCEHGKAEKTPKEDKKKIDELV